MHINHPEIAKRWDAEMKAKGEHIEDPEKKKRKKEVDLALEGLVKGSHAK